MKLPFRLKISIIVALLITFFVFLNLFNLSKEVKNFFYLVSSPIQKGLWQIGDSISDFFEAISAAQNLKKENEKLNLRIQELLTENSSLKELKRENQSLREALSLDLAKEFQLKMAEVIGKDISQDSLIINKGSKDGIISGLPVITSQKVLVGKIGVVYKNFSKVILISNKESSFDAKISDSETFGVIKGGGSFRLSLELVPRENEIKEGDIIVTTTLGGVFPAGLLVGQIKEIKKSDVEPFQSAEIEPAFDATELKNIFIITN